VTIPDAPAADARALARLTAAYATHKLAHEGAPSGSSCRGHSVLIGRADRETGRGIRAAWPGQAYRPRLRPMISFMISVVPPKNHNS
jgi:hypothetical protein